MKLDGDILSFIFKEGFWVSENNINNYNKKLSYTGKSEVKLKMIYNSVDVTVTVYVFTELDGKTIRETITLEDLMDNINNGMELEFLYSYTGYRSYVFECWLWFDNKPYHKECVLIISADEVTYSWNELFVDE